MLEQATEDLVKVARDPSSTEAGFRTAMQAFMNAVGNSSFDDLNRALPSLAGLFDLENLPRAGLIANVCGAYVEKGCDPMAIARPLIGRVQQLLVSAVELTNECLAEMGDAPKPDEDSVEAFERARLRVAPRMPRHVADWEALEKFWPPAIAVLSTSPRARADSRGLRDMAARIADYHEAGHWLRLILSVLDDEPILVIEPRTQAGILARISGMVENFQLNVLLMEKFPRQDPSAGPRVSQSAADVARGVGPQVTEETVQGAWNLYAWTALGKDGTLRDEGTKADMSRWIWNEGTPEDIPVFQDRRVILLGPATYVRIWKSTRMFDRLPAELRVEKTLSRAEVADWLRSMVAAKDAGRG